MRPKKQATRKELLREVKKSEEKISTPYVLERFTSKTNTFGDFYYFRVIRRRGGKIVLDSGEGYSTKRTRSRAVITLLNTLFRPGSVTIVDL